MSELSLWKPPVKSLLEFFGSVENLRTPHFERFKTITSFQRMIYLS